MGRECKNIFQLFSFIIKTKLVQNVNRMTKRPERHAYRQSDRQTDGQTDGQTYGQTDRWIHGRTDSQRERERVSE